MAYKVGQTIVAKISGVPQEVKVRAILETIEGLKLIVDFGRQQVATIAERDVVKSED